MPFRKPGWDLADWLQQHREPGCLADDRDRDLPKHAVVPRAAAGGTSRGGLPDPIIGREAIGTTMHDVGQLDRNRQCWSRRWHI
jgi:hypothetical protein